MKISVFFKKSYNWVLRNVFSKVFLLHSLEDLIIFESVPNLSDSTKPVFDYFVKEGYNKKYKMVWLLRDEQDDLPQIDNVSYIEMHPKTFKEKMRLYKLQMTAKCLVCCNYILTSQRKGQKSFYITHGSPLKSTNTYYYLPKNVDYCFVQAEAWRQPVAKQMHVDTNKIVSLGYPRNDVLTKNGKDLSVVFKRSFEKILVWYPTYRQHNAGGNNTASKNAIPIIYDEENAKKLNECLKVNKALLIVKPHFAQDISKIKDLRLDNIVLINDEFFVKNKITSYEFVGSCDALITDYSSIYYDFTLRDKPVAAIWEDIEDYRRNPGFAVDVDFYMKGAEKIYTVDDFIAFIQRVGNGEDILKDERNKIKTMVNEFEDGESTKRVAEFVIEKAGL